MKVAKEYMSGYCSYHGYGHCDCLNVLSGENVELFMRKTRSKQLRRAARALYKPDFPNYSPRRIYQALKKMWVRGLLTK